MKGDIEYKLQFMKEIEENYPDMVGDYITLFSYTRMGLDEWESEEGFNKDFYNFTREQVLEMLKAFQSSSLVALSKILSLLNKYSSDAFGKNKGRLSVINTQNIKKADLIGLVSENKQFKRNPTKKELYDKLPLLKNESDKLLLILYFKGIYGKENSEILNIKSSDFDTSTNTLCLNGKTYQFNNYEAQIIKNTINETEYKSYAVEEKTNKYTQSPYLFKNFADSGLRNNEDTEGRAKHTLIQRRIFIALKFIGEELWSPNTIYRSGIASKILADCDYKVLGSQDILRWKLKHGLTFDHVGMVETMDVIRQKIQEETEN